VCVWVCVCAFVCACMHAFVVPIDDHISTLGKYNCSCLTWQAKVLMFVTFSANAFICWHTYRHPVLVHLVGVFTKRHCLCVVWGSTAMWLQIPGSGLCCWSQVYSYRFILPVYMMGLGKQMPCLSLCNFMFCIHCDMAQWVLVLQFLF